MCLSCVNLFKSDVCNALDFTEMKVLAYDTDGTAVVKCDGFRREKKSE